MKIRLFKNELQSVFINRNLNSGFSDTKLVDIESVFTLDIYGCIFGEFSKENPDFKSDLKPFLLKDSNNSCIVGKTISEDNSGYKMDNIYTWVFDPKFSKEELDAVFSNWTGYIK